MLQFFTRIHQICSGVLPGSQANQQKYARPFKVAGKLLVYLPLLAVLTTSCVRYKNVVYMQDRNATQRSNNSVEYTTPQADYRLRSGDIVSVQISSATNEKLSVYSIDGSPGGQMAADPVLRGYSINDSGFVALPVFGNVKVAGFTIEEARQNIQKTALEYFANPVVKLNLLSFYVTLIGEFARPGRYIVYNPHLNILDALALGGDLNITAERTRLRLVRTEKGKVTNHFIDLTDHSLFSSPFFYLQPNDVLYAEPLRARTVQLNNATAIGIVSAVTNIALFVINIIIVSNRK